MTTPRPAALAFRELRFRYLKTGADTLDRISLEIPAGQVTAILGPNGAGKTTLLHLLLGYLHPLAGQILLHGRPLKDYPRGERGKLIGLVPQKEATTLHFSVLDYVLLGRAPYLAPLALPSTQDVAIAERALEMVGASALKHRLVPDLSGGEQQIVLAARALAQDPDIYLLDEPTSHLDLSNQNTIIRIMTSLAGRGKTVLFTTHDPNIAAMTADHIILMEKGRIHSFGPAEDILTRENLSAIYQTRIDVEQVNGQTIVYRRRQP